jgi:O-methyltransferase involved in polyketide biosynthesis
VRSTVSFALGIDGRGLSKEFLWRTDNNGWHLATSASATATVVTGYRAAATTRDQPLIGDPFADQLVPAVGMTFLPGWPAENWMPSCTM